MEDRAFAAFYEEEYRAVLALARVLTGDRRWAEDVAQDVFVAALAAWPELQNPATWVRTVAPGKSRPTRPGATTAPTSPATTSTAPEETPEPEFRFGFSSVWTGRELIVWGGHAPSDVARLLAFGTRWPSGPAVPATNDLLGAELVAGGWVEIPPVDFVTQTYANVADPGTASFSGDDVITWGDPSTDPGSARILLPDHTWVEAPPPPLGPNNAHPTPIVLGDGRILALAEDQSAAIWEPTLGSWTPVDGLPGITGREAMWTGEEVIAWLGDEVWRWTPPPPPAD